MSYKKSWDEYQLYLERQIDLRKKRIEKHGLKPIEAYDWEVERDVLEAARKEFMRIRPNKGKK